MPAVSYLKQMLTPQAPGKAWNLEQYTELSLPQMDESLVNAHPPVIPFVEMAVRLMGENVL